MQGFSESTSNHDLVTYLYVTIKTLWSWCAKFTKKKADSDSERTLLDRSQIRNLRSSACKSTDVTAANHITITWRQNLHKWEVLKAIVEMQVQSWTTNSQVSDSEFGFQVLRINLQSFYCLHYPRQRSNRLIFALIQKYISERDVHLLAMVWATARRRILAITLNCILNWGIWETLDVLISFFRQKWSYNNLEPTIYRNLQDYMIMTLRCRDRSVLAVAGRNYRREC